jgi:hypothetical protein
LVNAAFPINSVCPRDSSRSGAVSLRCEIRKGLQIKA